MTDNKCLSNLDINGEWLPKLHTEDENKGKLELENKYYTPSIEEFHVGFEYAGTSTYREMDGSPDIYHKNKFDLEEVVGFDKFKFLDTQLKSNCIRVKYLDREDIESLGFRLEQLTGAYDFEWTIIDKNGTCIGEFFDRSNDDINLFLYGTNFKIKNISELKVLLKQLGIDA